MPIIFGLLGPNGAGKSTLMRILIKQKKDYTGTVELFGMDLKETDIRPVIGFAPQEFAFFFDFTVEENLSTIGKLYGLGGRLLEERVGQALDCFGLEEYRKKRAADLSGGYKRLLDIALSTLHSPEILLLDEPTAGLDIGRTIGSMGTKLDSLRTTLDRFADSIGSFDEIDSNLADTGERLGKTRAKLEKYDKTLGDLITVIDDKIERMDQADSELTRQENSLYATPGIELVPDEYRAGASEAFDTTHGELSQMRSDLVKTRDDLESARESLKGLQADLEGMNSTLARMRAGLKEDGAYASSVQAQARAQLKDMRAGIFRADAALPGAADSIQSSTEFLAYSKETFPEITAAVDGQDDRMENYETLLSSASGSIGQLNKIDPETLAVPRISMMPTTPTSRYFDMLFPAIIGVISLFGCLLLPMIIRMRQREQGMELRLQLTTASTLAKVVGQYLSYTVIGMAQISIFALIGIAAYGVEIYGSWKLFLATLVLAPALFTAIGMLCASIVNRGSTAVLLTLLLGVPMLFLSGALIPLEFISEPFSTLGMLTPLYQVIELLGMAVLRGIAPAALGAALVIAVAFIVISLGAAYYIERKRACTG